MFESRTSKEITLSTDMSKLITRCPYRYQHAANLDWQEHTDWRSGVTFSSRFKYLLTSVHSYGTPGTTCFSLCSAPIIGSRVIYIAKFPVMTTTTLSAVASARLFRRYRHTKVVKSGLQNRGLDVSQKRSVVAADVLLSIPFI